MRRKLIGVVVVTFGVVLWGGVLAQSPNVPLAAVEANDGFGFGNGPVPFPGPKPPKPRPDDTVSSTVSGAEAVYAYAKGATWWTRRADGALRFHDCADAGRIEAQLAAAPADRKWLVEEMARDHSADMIAALAPARDAFRATVLRDEAIEEVNSRWWQYVGEQADQVVEAIAWMAWTQANTPAATTCTEGRCDCCTTAACGCGTGKICSCQVYTGEDCVNLRRDTCNVEEDAPEPTKSRVIRWNY